jgi:hypothetical protein
MALPQTGSISMSQVATELGLPTTGINLNSAAVRTLAGLPSTGSISMNDLRGKSNISQIQWSPTESINDLNATNGDPLKFFINMNGTLNVNSIITSVDSARWLPVGQSAGNGIYEWSWKDSIFNGPMRTLSPTPDPFQWTPLVAGQIATFYLQGLYTGHLGYLYIRERNLNSNMGVYTFSMASVFA